MTGIEVLLALVMAIGLAGILVVVVPGTVIIAAATLVWAFQAESPTAWAFSAAALVFLLAGALVKYVVPGRRLAQAGISGRTQMIGLAAGVVGFFLIPVVGLVLGFILGVWLAEAIRHGAGEATASTRVALAAAGLSLLIEFTVAAIAVTLTLIGMVVLT